MADRLDMLTKELQEFSITVDDDFLIKLNELCIVHSLDAEKMVDSWVAYAATKNCNPTLEFLTQFEREELGKLKKNKPSKSASSRKTTSDIEYLDQHLPEQRTPKTVRISSNQSPLFSPASYSPFPSTPSVTYASRKAAGNVISSFGSVENAIWSNQRASSCVVEPFDKETALQSTYSYMFEKFREYASVLNDIIEDVATVFQKQYEVTEWAPIQLLAMEPVPMVGRVCSEGGVKLNTQSLLLEGSLETSSGHILPLDVDHMEKFSFFPGQIVAGLGMNSEGKKIVMKELYQIPPPPFPEIAPNFGDHFDAMSVVVAAGPYTTSDSLSYEPLLDLIKYVKDNKPHICIFCGPFVDLKHEEIQKGNFPETYEEIFLRLVRTISSDLENSGTKVILVPSMRDAHQQSIYPTPPYEVSSQLKNLYLASDPCLLKINGIVFGITSTDVLMHLGKEEISFPLQSSDRLGRLCGHILNQRRFYPLYPPSEAINIDYVHYEFHAMLPVTPHVLIVPSDLRHFIKDVNGCCCVNPERLAKSSSGGTFVRMMIKAIEDKTYSGSIINNVIAEVVKI